MLQDEKHRILNEALDKAARIDKLRDKDVLYIVIHSLPNFFYWIFGISMKMSFLYFCMTKPRQIFEWIFLSYFDIINFVIIYFIFTKVKARFEEIIRLY
jgi:hypothetical protein